MSAPTPDERARADALRLAAELGAPARNWVIAGEGNCSVSGAAERMWVKASGARMAYAGNDDFVVLSRPAVLDLVDDPTAGADDVAGLFDTAGRVHRGRRPSVESLLHAVCLDQPGVTVVGHTHPVAVNAILCSQRPTLLTEGSLFPDQIVVLGTNPLLVPYVDPGLELARVVRDRLRDRVDPPKVIYLANHGLFALGATVTEVVDITAMAVKVAEILLGAAAVGGPTFLSESDVRRIDTRPDESYRRDQLRRRVVDGEEQST